MAIVDIFVTDNKDHLQPHNMYILLSASTYMHQNAILAKSHGPLGLGGLCANQLPVGTILRTIWNVS